MFLRRMEKIWEIPLVFGMWRETFDMYILRQHFCCSAQMRLTCFTKRLQQKVIEGAEMYFWSVGEPHLSCECCRLLQSCFLLPIAAAQTVLLRTLISCFIFSLLSLKLSATYWDAATQREQNLWWATWSKTDWLSLHVSRVSLGILLLEANL